MVETPDPTFSDFCVPGLGRKQKMAREKLKRHRRDTEGEKMRDEPRKTDGTTRCSGKFWGGVSFFFCAFSRLLGAQFAKNVFGNCYNGIGSHAGSPDKTRNRAKSGMEKKGGAMGSN